MHPLEERTGKIRSATIRKLGKDGSTLTPTEKTQKNKLMRQFSKFGRKGYEVSSGNSAEFREGWDRIFGSAVEKEAGLKAFESRRTNGEPGWEEVEMPMDWSKG